MTFLGRFAMLLLLIPFIYAQEIVHFDRLSVEEGLSQSTVAGLIQDQQGFLWFATKDGLNRYDGYSFKLFKHDPDDPSSLQDNYVERVYQDRSGQLWVGTYKGLSRYIPDSQTFINYQHDPADHRTIGEGYVMAITEDRQGVLWVGTFGGGLSYFDKTDGIFKHYRHNPKKPDSLSDNKVYSIFEDRHDNLWIGTREGGLNRFNRQSKTFTHFVHQPNQPNSLSHNRVYTIFEDHLNMLWVGTRGGGLNYFDRQTETFHHYQYDQNNPHSLNSDNIFAINEDSEGVLWVGTQNGLNRLDRQTGHFYAHTHNTDNQHSLSDSWVMEIVFDKTGIMWLGTHGGGVNKRNPALANFGHVQHHAGTVGTLNDNSVWSFYQETSGVLWVGTQNGGLNRFESNQETRYYLHQKTKPDSIADNFIGVIYKDSNGTLWIGTHGNGLSRFNAADETFTNYLIKPETGTAVVDINQIYAIIEGPDGGFWVGTRGGLHLFDRDTGTFISYRHDPADPTSLSDNDIQVFFVDQVGRFWVGTRKGLNLFDPRSKTFTRYMHDPADANSISDNSILTVYQDTTGMLWIGTKDGFNRFDPQQRKFKVYREKQGLSNNVVYGILEDKSANLWLSTNRGINRFNPQTEVFSHYYVNDGLQSNEFRQGAVLAAPDGRFFFGGINGYNAFYPEDIVDDPHAPTLAVTDFLLLNQSTPLQGLKANVSQSTVVDQNRPLVLRHSDNVFSFEFAALHYADPSSNQYAYRLDGFDENWIVTTANKRAATYTNIPAGNYTFRVMGSNPDGVWNSEKKSLDIIIKPAPWRTWWAYLIYLLMLAAVAAYVWRERYQKLLIRTEAAEKIKDSEERLSLALWGSGEQLWDWHIDKNQIHRRNTLVGFDFAEFEELNSVSAFSRKIHPEDKSGFMQALQQHMDEKSDNFESAHRVQNDLGEWVWVVEKGRVTSRDSSGRVLRMSGVLSDQHEWFDTQAQLKALNEDLEQCVMRRTAQLQNSIDRLEEAQEQLVQSEKMAALSYLVAGVAHEVNTPLGICVTVISLQLECIKTLNEQYKAGQIKASTLQKYLAKSDEQMVTAQRNIQRAADLVNNFKQVAVGQSHELLGECRLAEYLDKIINSVSSKINQYNLSVHIDVPDTIVLTTYPGVWTQVVSHFIDNSIKHGFLSSDGGEITLTAVQENDQLHFTYCDSGQGMSQEQVKRVFDPFYTTNREQGGTGLGMHIVFNLVTQKLLGQIKCVSEPGHGVTFTIDAPVVLKTIND